MSMPDSSNQPDTLEFAQPKRVFDVDNDLMLGRNSNSESLIELIDLLLNKQTDKVKQGIKDLTNRKTEEIDRDRLLNLLVFMLNDDDTGVQLVAVTEFSKLTKQEDVKAREEKVLSFCDIPLKTKFNEDRCAGLQKALEVLEMYGHEKSYEKLKRTADSLKNFKDYVYPDIEQKWGQSIKQAEDLVNPDERRQKIHELRKQENDEKKALFDKLKNLFEECVKKLYALDANSVSSQDQEFRDWKNDLSLRVKWREKLTNFPEQDFRAFCYDAGQQYDQLPALLSDKVIYFLEKTQKDETAFNDFKQAAIRKGLIQGTQLNNIL